MRPLHFYAAHLAILALVVWYFEAENVETRVFPRVPC